MTPRDLYSPVRRWRDVNKGNSHYSAPLAFVQAHAEAHIPVVKGEVVITEAASDSELISLVTAAQEYGLSDQRVEIVLREKLGKEQLPRFFKRSEIH